MATDVRAAAAGVLARVLGGRSLDPTLDAAADTVTERDRPLLAQLCYGTLRLAPRLEALATLLLERPLRGKDRDIHALLLLGLYQLSATRVPDHAAVSATVAATKTLGKGWARGLLNAVLRRFQRERDALESKLTPAAAAAHPAWLYDALAREWPADLADILAAGNSQPPMTLRVNRIRGSRGAYMERLAAADIESRAGALVTDAVYLTKARAVDALPGFDIGEASVQDEAAQVAAALLDARSGDAVLDACAAPGGKTCHILEQMPDCKLTAMDIDEARLQRVQENLERLGLQANCVVGDAADPGAATGDQRFQRILVDAPCSGSGVIRRHPDIKLLRRDDDALRLGARQQAILEGCWARLAPSGRLLYATCSILEAENSAVIDAFLQAHPEAREITPELNGTRRLRHGIQVLPSANGPDGLYYALLTRDSPANAQ